MKHFLFLLPLISLVFLTSCDDDDAAAGPTYQIPATYDFENVSYDGQLQRLNQLAEITAYLKTANTIGTVLDADRLQAMYENGDGAQFANDYDDSKQLRNKTLSSVQADFEIALDAIAEASTNNTFAGNGVAGIAVSSDGEKRYLLNENGLEYTQIIEKGLMGACLYYQATAVYFGDDRMNVDNETVEPGEGTEMEHHWDEAFGYLAVPRAFPVDTDGAAFWGKYSNDRDELLNTNADLMSAFTKGRAAISNKDIPTRDEAIGEARTAWERVVAGTAIHYLNSTLANFGDSARRAHALSEAVAFIYSLQFNPERRADLATINGWLEELVGSTEFTEMNLYLTGTNDLESVADALAVTYGMTDVQSEL